MPRICSIDATLFDTITRFQWMISSFMPQPLVESELVRNPVVIAPVTTVGFDIDNLYCAFPSMSDIKFTGSPSIRVKQSLRSSESRILCPRSCNFPSFPPCTGFSFGLPTLAVALFPARCGGSKRVSCFSKCLKMRSTILFQTGFGFGNLKFDCILDHGIQFFTLEFRNISSIRFPKAVIPCFFCLRKDLIYNRSHQCS